MKLTLAFVTISCLLSVAMTATQGSCSAASYCKTCKESQTANECDGCFNWGAGGTVGARELTGGKTCTTAVSNAVANCKIYSSGITSTVGISDCQQCNSKTWLNLDAKASPVTRACSDTSSDKTKCATAISNCEQSLCYKHTDSAFYSACAMCKSGYKGGTDAAFVGFVFRTTCVASTIADCDIGSSSDPQYCSYCKSGKSLANDAKTCIAHSADTNCYRLGTGNSYCYSCWDAYYFDTKTCKLAGQIVGFVGALAMALYALY